MFDGRGDKGLVSTQPNYGSVKLVLSEKTSQVTYRVDAALFEVQNMF